MKVFLKKKDKIKKHKIILRSLKQIKNLFCKPAKVVNAVQYKNKVNSKIYKKQRLRRWKNSLNYFFINKTKHKILFRYSSVTNRKIFNLFLNYKLRMKPWRKKWLKKMAYRWRVRKVRRYFKRIVHYKLKINWRNVGPFVKKLLYYQFFFKNRRRKRIFNFYPRPFNLKKKNMVLFKSILTFNVLSRKNQIYKIKNKKIIKKRKKQDFNKKLQIQEKTILWLPKKKVLLNSELGVKTTSIHGIRFFSTSKDKNRKLLLKDSEININSYNKKNFFVFKSRNKKHRLKRSFLTHRSFFRLKKNLVQKQVICLKSILWNTNFKLKRKKIQNKNLFFSEKKKIKQKSWKKRWWKIKRKKWLWRWNVPVKKKIQYYKYKNASNLNLNRYYQELLYYRENEKNLFCLKDQQIESHVKNRAEFASILSQKNKPRLLWKFNKTKRISFLLKKQNTKNLFKRNIINYNKFLYTLKIWNKKKYIAFSGVANVLKRNKILNLKKRTFFFRQKKMKTNFFFKQTLLDLKRKKKLLLSSSRINSTLEKLSRFTKFKNTSWGFRCFKYTNYFGSSLWYDSMRKDLNKTLFSQKQKLLSKTKFVLFSKKKSKNLKFNISSFMSKTKQAYFLKQKKTSKVVFYKKNLHFFTPLKQIYRVRNRFLTSKFEVGFTNTNKLLLKPYFLSSKYGLLSQRFRLLTSPKNRQYEYYWNRCLRLKIPTPYLMFSQTGQKYRLKRIKKRGWKILKKIRRRVRILRRKRRLIRQTFKKPLQIVTKKKLIKLISFLKITRKKSFKKNLITLKKNKKTLNTLIKKNIRRERFIKNKKILHIKKIRNGLFFKKHSFKFFFNNKTIKFQKKIPRLQKNKAVNFKIRIVEQLLLINLKRRNENRFKLKSVLQNKIIQTKLKSLYKNLMVSKIRKVIRKKLKIRRISTLKYLKKIKKLRKKLIKRDKKKAIKVKFLNQIIQNRIKAKKIFISIPRAYKYSARFLRYDKRFFYKQKKYSYKIFYKKFYRRNFKIKQADYQRYSWLEPLLFPKNLYKTHRFMAYRRRQNPKYTKKNQLFFVYRSFLFNQWGLDLKLKRFFKIHLALHKIITSFYGEIRMKQLKVIKNICARLKPRAEARSSFFLNRLERRLDVVLFRMNLAPTVQWARTLIKDKLITIDGRIVFNCHFLVQDYQLIQVNGYLLKYFNLKKELFFNKFFKKAIPSNMVVNLRLNAGIIINMPRVQDLSKKDRIRTKFLNWTKLTL